ncbi:MAG: glycoside hydrolase family 78 protein [Tannerella sp.]|nr:glycoside hydrolase family 78 protein [Tannerella sp.]
MKKILFAIMTACLFMSCGETAVIRVDRLRCGMLENPFGIEAATPDLSWELSSGSRGIRQESHHILVASSLELLNLNQGDVWDSKEVSSVASVYVPYGGRETESRATYFWKVRVKTNRGYSEWSQPAEWTTGLLHPSDWQAGWTGLDRSFPDDELEGRTRLAARYFRKEFAAEKDVRKATLYISGLGLYEAYLNHARIGTQELSPTPTDYSKVIKYNVFDVTPQIKKGDNAIGVILGNGRFFSMRNNYRGIPPIRNFGFPKMILQLEVEYADGSKTVVASDDSWTVTADGPILSNSEFDGEEYDARKELRGWDMPGFDDSKWLKAEPVQSPGGKLEAQRNRNIKIMDTVKPKNISEVKPGTYILDMGQNMVGWLRLKVRGQAGAQIRLRFAESLKDDGTLYMDNIRGALVTDKYTLRGDAEETWEPSFTYHGFRFVEITGFPGKPDVDSFEGQVLYDEMETTGFFETSSPTVNQIYRNACWGIRGNYRGMPTDCPQRDERMGWLGDRAVGSHGESFIFDNNNLYAKWLDDIEQSQRETGSIPDVAPNYWSMYSDNMTWPGAYLIIANMLHEQYGNKEPVVRHYESMKKWLNYMRDTYMEDYIMLKDTYGDWCMPPESPELIHSGDPGRKTDAAVLGTAFYYRMLFLMERFSKLLNKPEDTAEFVNQAKLVKEAFNNRFLDKSTGRYSNNTVTANLLPLCYGMTPEEYREAVFGNIVDKTLGEFNGHVSTGLVGIQWLMRGLSDYGRADIALQIVTNRDYPSWGYMVENGATTIWELWNGNTANPAMNSGNHVMLLGDLIVWFYEYLAGIQNEAGSTGFERISMKPYPVAGLDYVKASYRSVHGLIESAWEQSGDTFQWKITVPGNSVATVYIPASSKNRVTENGKPAASATGVKYMRTEGEYAVFEVGSGNYHFSVNK